MCAARAAALAAALIVAPLAARAATIAETETMVLTSPGNARQDAVLSFRFDAAAGAVAITGPWDQASLALPGGSLFAVPAYVADGSASPGSASYGAGPIAGSYRLALDWHYLARAPNGWQSDLALSLTALADRPLFTPDGGVDPGFFASASFAGSLAGQSAGLDIASVPARFVQTGTALAFAAPLAVPEPSAAALLAGAALICAAFPPRRHRLTGARARHRRPPN
ncbi:MAG: hypothetical protein KGI51_10530 [Rhodospirillales bacterium]|nr:hypothetical protein [Rhodospirillales bacterium]